MLLFSPSLSRIILPAVGLILSAISAPAQMKSGTDMQNFNQTFNLTGAPGSGSYAVSYRGCTVSPSNILYPGDQPEFDFQLQNKTGQAIVADGKAELIPFGTKGISGDIWTPLVFANGDVQSVPVHANIPANGTQELKVTFNVPEKMGGYAIVFDLGSNGRQWGTSLARTFPAANSNVPLPKMLLDASVGLDGLNRLGVGSVRRELGFAPGDKGLMDQIDQALQDYQKHHITCLIVWGAADGSKQPGGVIGRPWLGDDDTGIAQSYDRAWLPEQDDAFRKWVGDVAKKWGYPKGPVVGVELWNEPWEGSSISGWASDMLRYREMFTKMAEGIEDARAQGAQVMITGCDSSTNSWDKLFCDGTNDYLKWFDACTIHYQGIAAPSLYKDWLGRKGPNGRVKIWDTESWVANTDDRVATTVALDRAAGYDRGMGVFGGDVTTAQDNGAYEAWPLAASVGAVQHFVGERDFKELLFKKGLPWIFVFNGLNGNEEDGSVVVSGDIGEVIGEDQLLFRNVRGLKEMKDKEALRAQLAALPAGSPDAANLQQQIDKPEVLSGGLLTMTAIPHVIAYDFYGNEVPAVNNQIQIPLDFRGYYLRTDGTPGAFAQLLDGLRNARIDGYEPVEIIAHDALKPFEQGGTIRLSVTNILNRPVQGALQATATGFTMDTPSQQLSFAPFETKEIMLKVNGAPPADNSYPLRVVFDAGADGKAVHVETMHVNEIAHRTITVDGKLDDWKGVLPQGVVAAGTGGPTMEEAAWLPFKNFASNLKSGVATSYMAYDDKYFYFAAKIADSTPDEGAIRFAKEDSDAFFYPDVFYLLDPSRNPNNIVADWKPASANDAPRSSASDPNARIAKSWQSGANAGIELVLQAPTDKASQLALYFPGGQKGTAKVQFVDNGKGNILLHHNVPISGSATYAVFNVKGSLHVTIRNSSGPVAVAGLFLDDAASSQLSADEQNGAEFVSLDSSTLGNWPGKYGKNGQWLAGNPTPQMPGNWQLSAGALVKYTWPAGVRHYTYRKDTYVASGTAPALDNVQIGFNVLPPEDKITIPNPPGTMPGFVPGQDTDYEFALNKVAAKYGGGTEIWRLRVPGMPSKNFYPREPSDPKDGAVTTGKLMVTRTATTRIVEAAIPWSEIPEVKAAAEAGKTIKFTYRVNDNGGIGMELARGRSVSKINPHSLHADWNEHWSNEVEFGFEKKSSQ